MFTRIANANPEYQAARKARDALEAHVKDANTVLSGFPKSGPMGATPDAVRATPEWVAAKRAYDTAFATLRDFNKTFVPRFKKEEAEEREKRRSAWVAP